jgi:hypothetical protein
MRKAALMMLLQHRGHLRQAAKVSSYGTAAAAELEVASTLDWTSDA